MKHIYAFIILLLLLPMMLFAQLTVVSTSPANGTTNVPLTTTLSITFSLPVDSTGMNFEKNIFSNVDSMISSSVSGDKKTYSATVVLKANTVYFYAVVGGKATTGETMSAPFVTYFATGSSFPTLSVSGTVTSNISGVTPQYTIVGLSTRDVMTNDGPSFVSWANVNSNGTFQIPYVSNGTYWPIAAKDVDGDGNLNPENGSDAVAFGEPIIVNGSSIVGIVLPLQQMKPKTLADAWTIGDSVARKLPVDRVLKTIHANNVDTAGRSDSWTFVYVHSGNAVATEVSVGSISSDTGIVTDPGYLYGLVNTNPLANPATAAASTLVMSFVEGEGGRAFRMQPVPDNYVLQIEVALGDLAFSNFGMMFPTPGTQYWGVAYRYGIESYHNFTTYLEKKFLCNFSTGVVVKSTSVESLGLPVPVATALHQNYPNPFNPSTTITYDLANSSFVTLRVYDLLGREVTELVRGEQNAGAHTVRFDGSHMSDGIYFYALDVEGRREVKQMVLLK